MTENVWNEEAKAVVLGVLLGGLEDCRRTLRENASDEVAETNLLLDDWREVLSRCCNPDLIRSLDAQRLIRIAERLAEGGEEAKDATPRQLRSVFDSLEPIGKRKPTQRRVRLRPQMAAAVPNDLSIFVKDSDGPASEEISAHRQAFELELEQMKQRAGWADFDYVYTHLLNMLQMYGWCLPAGSDPSDVSIYSQ